MQCGNCKQGIIGVPRTSNGMGSFCRNCIPNCHICGKPVNTIAHDKCNLCWEVMTRLDKFLESKGGKDVIWAKLVNLGVI
ncbi:hypothetical protein LCGC14_0225400 [marine sediment metagenome]|uniref:Uncharacterized protein n=1 Tax=marine sediment metagenome TaxID=412755 RepID=A0A0F9WX32_9ZZZZ